MEIRIPDLIDWHELGSSKRRVMLQRPPLPASNTGEVVANIISQVRDQGDQALLTLGKKFDGIAPESLEVSSAEWAEGQTSVGATLLQAIDDAIHRIDAFHRAGAPDPVELETAPGLLCQARYLPISPVGLYIPGGSAPLISTAIMLAVPARIAACEQVVLCTPPDKNGKVHPAILAAAQRCGVRRVFKTGGAQAIAAMGLGTETIPACAKLFGPGNAWVTEAKQQISILPGGAARDMPAGPSEVLVIADDGADPVALCWDLLSQAEHGPDSQALLLSDNRKTLKKVRDLLPRMAATLPRAEILAESLQHTRLIFCDSLTTAVGISNRYAPEHLILNCRDASLLVDEVSAAGSVFVGPWTPESLGDYCSGTNHVLPTYGYARAYSGLSVNDFLRRMTVQTATGEGLMATGAVASELAAAEGLDAHRQAVEYRLEKLAAERPEIC